MAKFAKNNFHKFWLNILIILVLLTGLLIVLSNIRNQQTLKQHASQDMFTAVAVQGSIYIDSNKNGRKDANEINYTGYLKPKVQLALFSNICPPPPTINVSMTPIPPGPPPAGCYYRKFCPMIACRLGQNCKPCTPELVCETPLPSKGPIPPQGGGLSTGAIEGNSINVPIETSIVPTIPQKQDQTELSDAQKMDVCGRMPVKIVDCTVNIDGTYNCIDQGTTFVEGTVRIIPPSFYYPTSENPVDITNNVNIVNFGIYPRIFQGQPMQFSK